MYLLPLFLFEMCRWSDFVKTVYIKRTPLNKLQTLWKSETCILQYNA